MITGARMTYSEGSGARDKDTNAHENSVNDGADTPIEELRTRLREKEDFLDGNLCG